MFIRPRYPREHHHRRTSLSISVCVCGKPLLRLTLQQVELASVPPPPPSLPSLKPNAEVVFSLESDASLSLSLSSEVIESFIKMASYKLSGLSEEEISKDLN